MERSMTFTETVKTGAAADLDGLVRRVAKRAGYIAQKRRGRGYMLRHPQTNACMWGSWYDLTAQDVLNICGREIVRPAAPALDGEPRASSV
jgi:hypothetical protein